MKQCLILFIGLILIGCKATFTDSEDSSPMSASTDFATGTFRAELVLRDHFNQPSTLFNRREVITLEYRLTNLTNQDIKITFRSGQRISSVVTENGRIRLNIDALFFYTQAISDEVIPANQTKSFTLNFNADLLGAGTYQLIAGASLSDINSEVLVNNSGNPFVDTIDFEVQD